MKKLFISQGKPCFKNVTIPELLPNTILVKTTYSFISKGTELATIQQSKLNVLNKIYNNFQDVSNKVLDSLKNKGLLSTYFLTKSNLYKSLDIGYSSSGIVVASKSDNFRVGDFVACAGFGYSGHSEYNLIPQNLAAHLNHEKDLLTGSATTVGAIALQSLRRLNLGVGEKLCVFGLGIIGLFIVQLAKLSGLEVVGIDVSCQNLDLAKNLGADHVVLSNDRVDWKSQALHFSKNLGFDGIIVSCHQTKEVLNDACVLARQKGKVVIVGSGAIVLDRELFYQKELDILSSCSYGPGRYDANYEQQGLDYPYSYVRWTEGRNLSFIAKLISSQKLKVLPIISQVVPFEQAEQAYDLLEKGSVSVALEYSDCLDDNKIVQNNDNNLTTSLGRDEYGLFKKNLNPAILKSKVKCAFLGTGAFAKTTLAPKIKSIPKVELVGCYDISDNCRDNFSKTFGCKIAYQSYYDILSDPGCDAVVVATPERLHQEQALALLQQSKAVFCEKPLAVNEEQFEQIYQYLIKNDNCFFMVDFNRSFSPMFLKLKQILINKVTPFLLNYRVNSQGANNSSNASLGDKVVNEVCHFLHLFLEANPDNYVTKLLCVFVGRSQEVYLGDNLTIALTFSDGSIANLCYTSMSAAELAKERLECFWENKSVIIDDFKNCHSYNIYPSIDENNFFQDKGHKNLLELFFESVRMANPKMLSDKWPNIFIATYLSLKIKSFISEGGGIIEFSHDEMKEFFRDK